MNYFILFNIPMQFKIDKELLTENFYKLQLKFHPDLFIQHSKIKKKEIFNKSIEINQGYKVLNDSLKRAIHLLYLHGIEIKKEMLFVKNKSFLTKYFCLYEELDILKKNNFNKIKFNILLNTIATKIEYYENEIEIAFNVQDYKKIVDMIEKLLFFKKMKLNVKKEQKMCI